MKLAKVKRRQIFALLALGVAYGGLEVVANVANTEIPQTISDIFVKDGWDAEVRGKALDLEKKYNLKIHFSHKGKVSLEGKKRALDTLARSFGKYPTEMVRGLNLVVDMEAWIKGGFFGMTLQGALVPGPKEPRRSAEVVLNVLPGWDAPWFGEAVVHHELAHCFELVADGLGEREKLESQRKQELDYLRTGNGDIEFETGKKLIDKKYDRILGRVYQDWPRNKIGSKTEKLKRSVVRRIPFAQPEGYADSYGLINGREDRATVIGLMFGNPAKLSELCKEDEVLAKKVAVMKKYYLKWSNGRMDEQYWKDLGEGRVNEGYWYRGDR